MQEEVLILTELLEDITKNMLAPETFAKNHGVERIINSRRLSRLEPTGY